MITLLTIGQTPREDLLHPFKNLYDSHSLNLIGALDLLTEKEIRELEKLAKNPLLVRTRYGSATIEHAYIESKLQQLIENYEGFSQAIVILCTGEFACQSKKSMLIKPSHELRLQMREVAETARVLIFIPIEEQYQGALQKWNETPCELMIKVMSPSKNDLLQQIGTCIEQLKPDYILLDCYGYPVELPKQIKQQYGCTVFSPQQAVLDRLKQLD